VCESCSPLLNRRSLIRSAMLGTAALAAGSLWTPSAADAAGDDDDGSGSGTTVESEAMAEDTRPLTSSPPGVATVGASGGTVKVYGTRTIPAPNLNAYNAPPIISRAQWGADEKIRLDTRAYAPIRKLIVHHTASANKPSSPASVVRFVEEYHASGRGFSDTGYNYLIDHKGNIYEGRAARRYGTKEAITGEDNKGWGVVGAHAKHFNAGSCGICLIGDFETATPTDAALSSLVWVMAWKASRHRIDAHGKDEYIDIYGTHTVFPNISGHRQVGQTVCPGSRLYKLLPSLRDQVGQLAGTWDPLVVDIPDIVRYEYGNLRASTSSGSTSGSSTPTPAPTSASTPASATPTTTSAVTTTPGSGTKLTGIRVVSNSGTIYTIGDGRKLGNPSSNGITTVVALANTAHGDGYWALGSDGKVGAFGGLGSYGDASGKGVSADIVGTASGAGYWILLANGGIYPFGDAGYASSPKRAGIGGTAIRMAARPQGDGYWVLMSDKAVHAFGAAPKLGSPTDAGVPIDLRVTPSGAGYWVLTDAGRVVPFGDAVDKGDLKRSNIKWSKPVARLLGTPSGKGYVIINSEGSLLAFGDAPAYPSLGGSGITAAGIAPAFG
jgi:N-acetylmuramoyl-L-alanine amidase-like protein